MDWREEIMFQRNQIAAVAHGIKKDAALTLMVSAIMLIELVTLSGIIQLIFFNKG